MLAQHSALIDAPFSAVERRLLAGQWRIRMDAGGEEMLASVGVRIRGFPIYRMVRVQLGEPVVRIGPSRVLVPVRWEKLVGPQLFPRLDGYLELEACAAGSRLTLNATYDPPLGIVGEMLDRAALWRLADASLQDFVERLGKQLGSRVDGAATAV